MRRIRTGAELRKTHKTMVPRLEKAKMWASERNMIGHDWMKAKD